MRLSRQPRSRERRVMMLLPNLRVKLSGLLLKESALRLGATGPSLAPVNTSPAA